MASGPLHAGAMRTFFATVRDWWKQRRAEGERLLEMADRLDLWLDPTNYEVRQDATHGTVIINVALERVQSERASEQQENNDQMLVIGVPIRCRTILDERRIQTDDQLEELWQAWLRIREFSAAGAAPPGGEGRFGDEYANAITGGIAVFLWHGEWLSDHEERRRSIEAAVVGSSRGWSSARTPRDWISRDESGVSHDWANLRPDAVPEARTGPAPRSQVGGRDR